MKYITFLEVKEHLTIILFCSETQKCFVSYVPKSISLSLQRKFLEKNNDSKSDQRAALFLHLSLLVRTSGLSPTGSGNHQRVVIPQASTSQTSRKLECTVIKLWNQSRYCYEQLKCPGVGLGYPDIPSWLQNFSAYIPILLTTAEIQSYSSVCSFVLSQDIHSCHTVIVFAHHCRMLVLSIMTEYLCCLLNSYAEVLTSSVDAFGDEAGWVGIW